MWLKRSVLHLKQLKQSGRISRFTIEITLILIVKLVLIWLLWNAFFSQPVPKHDRQPALTRMMLNQPDSSPAHEK